MANNVGKRIRALRLQRGYTQQQLAHLLKITDHGTVSRLESGKHTPYVDTLIKLSKIFKVPISDLIEKPHGKNLPHN